MQAVIIIIWTNKDKTVSSEEDSIGTSHNLNDSK